MLAQVQALALDFGFAGAAAVLMRVQVHVLALGWRFGFAGAAAVLMLAQVQMLALDRRWLWTGLAFRFASAEAVLVLVLAFCGHCCHAGARAGPRMTSRQAQR